MTQTGIGLTLGDAGLGTAGGQVVGGAAGVASLLGRLRALLGDVADGATVVALGAGARAALTGASTGTGRRAGGALACDVADTTAGVARLATSTARSTATADGRTTSLGAVASNVAGLTALVAVSAGSATRVTLGAVA